MDIEISKYKAENRGDWEDFVKTSVNGTFYHSMNFLDYYAKGKIEPHHLFFKKKGNILAIFACGISYDCDKKILLSPYCASFGGFVHKYDLKLKDALSIVEEFLTYCKNNGVDKVFITQPLQIYYKAPIEYMEFALMKYGFLINSYELSVVLKLQDDLLMTFNKQTRANIRKAEKFGVNVSESNDFSRFYEILIENRKKHGVVPAHSLDDLLALKQRLPKQIRLFMAYFKQEAIAGTLIYLCNEKTFLDYYWAHKDEYQSLRPINKLVYDIAQWGIKNDFQYFDFGTTTLNMMPSWGGTRFKESFNARGVLRITYVKTI